MATRLDRDLTEFGANLQHTATTANVTGVNDLRVAPIERGNIQHYLDWFFTQESQKAVVELQKKLADNPSVTARRQIEKKLAIEEARQKHFEELRGMPNAYARYMERDRREADLQQQFGVPVRLGSIRVGRTSKTSKEIMNREKRDWRRFRAADRHARHQCRGGCVAVGPWPKGAA